MPKGVYKRSLEQIEELRKIGIKKGQKLSSVVRKKMSESRIGRKNTNWKTGKIIRKDGYVWISDRRHPYCNVRGYILEHRLVMEKHIGRYLLPHEVIHHINKNPGDNKIENLMLFPSAAEHKKHHLEVDGHWNQGNKRRGI